MVEAAAHLVDHVLPYIPYRQFVITFPHPLRYWLNTNKKLFAKVHKIVIRSIHQHYIDHAKNRGVKNPTPGSISYTQRWSSNLRLNPHLHILLTDGAYTTSKNGPKFRKAGAITDDEVAELLTKISDKVIRYLKKKGYLDKEGMVVDTPISDPLFADNEVLSVAAARATEGKIAFGRNAGKYVTKIGAGFGYAEEIPMLRGSLCFSINGFSLHGATRIKSQNRDGLEKLIRYIARGPIANKRLSIQPNGHVLLELKRPYSDGTTHMSFEPTDFIAKIVALIPPNRSHLVRWAGCFAPNAPLRNQIILDPTEKKGFDFDGSVKKPNYTWSEMLKRVFKIDVLHCDNCGGRFRPICAVTDLRDKRPANPTLFVSPPHFV
jgi:hypothetical protein